MCAHYKVLYQMCDLVFIYLALELTISLFSNVSMFFSLYFAAEELS